MCLNFRFNQTQHILGLSEKGSHGMNREEVIKVLSEMHLEHSKDPETLFAATFHEFDRAHPSFAKHGKLQSDLYYLCCSSGDQWTESPNP